jgi:hypothetical protein
VIQQSVGSNYLAALNSHGGSALVSTTSLYTLYDDIIQPEVGNPTSDLPGASVTKVQGEPRALHLHLHLILHLHLHTATVFLTRYAC